jgi:NAD(P)-dependent dehydrogenase (short-subunit alcohol dehydrogenase family)
MRRLDGKVAVVTGASSGFGRAIARAFAGEDAKVVVSDIRDEPLPGGFEDDLDTTTVQAIEADGGTAIYVNCDVTKPAQVQAMIEATVNEFGRLDILINNAGIYRGGKLMHEFTDEDLDACFTVDVKAPGFVAGGRQAVSAPGRRRQHHQPRLDGGTPGPSAPIGLQHIQGGAGEPHALPGDRVRPRGDQGQRDLPDLRQDRADA